MALTSWWRSVTRAADGSHKLVGGVKTRVGTWLSQAGGGVKRGWHMALTSWWRSETRVAYGSHKLVAE